ncbi:hypothetical protein KKA85_12430, partial [bacterium]|nr:hypothetical protein [bacterium]
MMTRNKLRKMFLLLAALSLLALAGCSEDTPLAPIADPDPQTEAPTLPDASKLQIDLSFFDQGRDLDKAAARWNFFNAYLRAVVVTAMTEVVLAPPVAAFSLAVHTVPSYQPDGSWLWVYTFVNGAQEAQIRLRGIIGDDHVDWEMRVTALDEGIENALWFDGATRDQGDTGDWTFYDVAQAGDPAVAELHWAHRPASNTIRVVALLGDDAGNALTFSEADGENRIDFDENTGDAWFIRWVEADGTGSLRVSDYNGGQEACWDEQQ